MPPIQITRAEYERKFGVKPIASPMSILEDEKPAPIRITRAEWNALQQQWNPQPQTYAQDAKSDIAETKSAVLATADRGATVSGGISNRVASGDTSKVKGMFQKFGNSLLSTGGMVLDVGIGAAKSILPQKAEDSVKKFFEGFGNEITEYNKDFYEKKLLPDLQSNDPDTRNAAKLIVETLDAYKNDADFRDTVNASGGIVGALFATKVKDGVSNTLDTAIDTSKKGFNTAKEVVEPIKKKFDERNFNGFTEELSKIESKNVKTRNANTFAKDIDGSTRRIYESNVLDGSVDNNGLLQTKVAGGAIDQYKAQTIDGFEDIVKRKLEDTKETMPFADVGKALKIEIGRSGLEGADLVTALKKIENELKGLAVRTKGSSIIDLTYLQDAKIATTRNINYLTPPEKATYRKAVARAYKVLIEKNSTKFDVKAVNEGPLARAYEDIARLERLDGARAEGGRLGKYTASLAGTLIGGAAGSVGGGVGAAIGGVVGGELAQAMKGAGMARTFKGGGKGLTPDPLLVRTKLSIPDKPVRANVKEGVKKTKEITDLESQIAKNVADQKKAIKKGDFALVQALKEIYEVLVDELKKAVKYLNDNASVGMSIKRTVTPESVAKKADKADMKVLADVIDDYDNAILEPNVNTTLNGMGLGRATREERISFAKDVFDEKDGVAMKPVTTKKYSKGLGTVKLTPKDSTSATWQELSKKNPDLFNRGILRKSLKPMDAKGIIPENVHTTQGKWQNYGQDSEISADIVYKRIESGSFKGEYEDKLGNVVRDKNGNILQDTYDDATGQWTKPMVSNKELRDELLAEFSTKEGKQYLSEVIDALPKNKDGSITAYRIGEIGDGTQSYTLSEGMAKTFSNQGTDIMPAGLPGLPTKGYKDFGALPANMVKIDPKGIKAWSPYDAEILVDSKFVQKKGLGTMLPSKSGDLVNEARKYKSAEEFVKGFEKRGFNPFGIDDTKIPKGDIELHDAFMEYTQKPEIQKLYNQGKNDTDVLTDIWKKANRKASEAEK